MEKDTLGHRKSPKAVASVVSILKILSVAVVELNISRVVFTANESTFLPAVALGAIQGLVLDATKVTQHYRVINMCPGRVVHLEVSRKSFVTPIYPQ